jgi:maleate isomerase
MPSSLDSPTSLRDFYGSRARIGVIYMASSTVMEPELAAMAPAGVSIHTTRIRLPDVTESGIARMMESDGVSACAGLLADAPLHCITFAGTGGTFLKGVGWDHKIIERMKQETHGIPCSTTASAVVRALKALSIKRVSVVTPYLPQITELGRKFLIDSGFDVVSVASLGLADDRAIGDVPLERVYEFAKSNSRAHADALFISCTNFRSVGAIEALEQELGRPVISSTQATFWDCLKLADVSIRVEGFGRLLR